MTAISDTSAEQRHDIDRWADRASHALRIFADAALGGRSSFGRLIRLGLHFAYALADRIESRDQAPAGRDDLDRRFGNGTRDIVEEGSWESFPASDPPSTMRPRG